MTKLMEQLLISGKLTSFKSSYPILWQNSIQSQFNLKLRINSNKIPLLHCIPFPWSSLMPIDLNPSRVVLGWMLAKYLPNVNNSDVEFNGKRIGDGILDYLRNCHLFKSICPRSELNWTGISLSLPCHSSCLFKQDPFHSSNDHSIWKWLISSSNSHHI